MIPSDEISVEQMSESASACKTPPDSGSCIHKIATLLKSLDDAAGANGQSPTLQTIQHENRLAQSRLGVASGLFSALRCRHAPTASHSIRVALGCSSWSIALNIPGSYCEAIEVAALLHDIGKIGVPEHILLKPGRLLPDEEAVMAYHRAMSIEIVSACCANSDLLDIVRYASTWYDGSRHGLEKKGSAIPLGARMLAIVDAFDAMTTDHVYRRAKSRERALAELFTFAGTQFDPELVKIFHHFHSKNQVQLDRCVLDHWLKPLADDISVIPWQLNCRSVTSGMAVSSTAMFESKLIDNMHDGIMFVDRQLHILQWNTGAERMTGVAADAARGRIWKPSLLEMRDEQGKFIRNDNCPIANAIATGVQSIQRLTILGRHGRDMIVDMHSIPVRDEEGKVHGATVLFHDASPEASLEEKCQILHLQATKDPLTQVANRAEFDRMHQLFIDAHLESGIPCSLIISDIDFFKRVNDTYGHQAGDEAITRFASLLKEMCRTGDLVARYGGEEFVVLCADCNNTAAARRAEEIRKKLSETKHAALGNRSFTASFGVTELQPGDTPATMLRRADRALLQAKDQGRNQVVQLGDGMGEIKTKHRWWPFGERRNATLLEADLVTVVPIEIAVQKLRGFIADQTAKIIQTNENQLELEIPGDKAGLFRRQDDRPVPFVINIHFEEHHKHHTNQQGLAAGDYVETHVHVVIRPQRARDRRHWETAERARMILVSLKSYLMAKDKSEHANGELAAIEL
ncbi:MAG: diguanylate cyclase [Pirellulales bacterium]|nr:diguanylate cyclase [Pirellulales bacterium]